MKITKASMSTHQMIDDVQCWPNSRLGASDLSFSSGGSWKVHQRIIQSSYTYDLLHTIDLYIGGNYGSDLGYIFQLPALRSLSLDWMNKPRKTITDPSSIQSQSCKVK